MIAILAQGWACLGKVQRASPVFSTQMGAESAADLLDLKKELNGARQHQALQGKTCMGLMFNAALVDLMGKWSEACGRDWTTMPCRRAYLDLDPFFVLLQ